MTLLPSTPALMSDLGQAVAELVHNCLLVAGGYLVGHLAGGLIGWALGKYVFRQDKPELLHQASRTLGGVTLALLVALYVFTGRGKPQGEGGDGRGTPTPEGGSSAAPSAPAEPAPNLKPDLPPPPTVTPGEVTLRVTVLGGEDVRQDRYYVLDDDRANPKTFAELKQAILERKSRERGRVMLAILFPPRNALPREHPAVTQLGRWANEEAKLDVIFPSLP